MLEFKDLSPSTKKQLTKFNNKWGRKISVREILKHAPDERSLRRFIRKYPKRWEDYEAACERMGAEEAIECPSD